MKKIHYLIALMLWTMAACVPSFEEGADLPDDPSILEILVGNQSGKLAQENAIDTDSKIDTVWVKDRSADFSNVYLNANLAEGCTIEPLDGAPKFGVYGDFSVERKYRVTAPSGNTADWSVVLEIYTPPVGCLADRWTGAVGCTDGVWPSYSPSSCVGEKVGGDCQRLNLTFDFWGDASAVVTIELALGDIDFDTFTGEVTLLNDVNFNSYGADMTFHAGPAGTYNATSNVLNLSLSFSGYDIGSDVYPFTVQR